MSPSKLILKYLLMLPGVLLLGLFISSPFVPTAAAIFRGCRSDPIVILSDGTILDVQAEIATDVGSVREIHYTVHGPPGVQLIAAIRTPLLGFEGKETFTYIADANPREYVTETLVRTSESPVKVTSHTTFVNATLLGEISLNLFYKPVTGYNDQVLRYVIRR